MTAREGDWQRLDPRMIWVDAAQALVSLVPAAIAVVGFGATVSELAIPVLIVAVVGVGGAAYDALRWVKTRYRITDEYVERRTGLLFREHRSIRRDRIRSVDTSAKLRHRLAGLRLVTIGAGQQQATGEAALALDAVSSQTAEQLRELLLGRSEVPASREPQDRELARIRWSWIVYNMFNVWAYLAGAGVLWGLHWLAGMFGLNPIGYAMDLVGWGRLGWVWSAFVIAVGVGLFGAGVLAVNFVTENWNFRLTRVEGENGTVLRTTQGLFKTREVNRDDNRLRGVEISEPLLWRWMKMADTNVITTGLAIWSLTPATTVVPRGPVDVARRVAAEVLERDPSPLAAPLRTHPRAALRRRRLWALLVTAAVVGGLGWLAATGPLPAWAPLAGVAVLPMALAAAAISYRALGHTLADGYLVVRSGLLSRSTAALQLRAVIGCQVRQSVLQRRLGLASVAVTTAAGYGSYGVPDLDADKATALATRLVGQTGILRTEMSDKVGPKIPV